LGTNEKALQAALVAISNESRVPVKTLQAQHQQYTVGPAGLLMANELAHLTKRPAQQFLAERGGKVGWDAIAERNGVNPDVLLPKLQQLHRVMFAANK
ncbi:MAG TPA: hypothetical protein VNT26_05740, partial [Candidatus Sulfotelmatobacter sp.]|nr:hypothetical protein [Candidatus Sulfotelmatobacter sp.]